MNTPLSWIKAYVPDLECEPKEYMEKVTLTGTKVESYEKFDENLEKIVVGKILKIEDILMQTSLLYARYRSMRMEKAHR